jgi:hypothetical protein
MTSPLKPSRAKVQEHRKRLRSQSLRPIQIWVPDVPLPAFRSEARRQARAVAGSPNAREDQAFIDAAHLHLHQRRGGSAVISAAG